MDRAEQRLRGGLVEQRPQQRSRLLAIERLERQLLEIAAAAQLVAQPAQGVVAGEPVGSVGGDDHDRHLPDRRGKRREQLQARLVGPLQVIEDDQRLPAAREVGKSAAHGLEDRRTVALASRLAELGQEQGEV